MAILFSSFNLGQGLNLGVNEYLNKVGECREALGCDFSEAGVLAKFPGYSTYGTGLDASSVLGLYDFKTISGDATVWLAKTGTVLYYDNSGTWTSAQTGLTAEDVTFCTHLDTAIMGSATDAPKKSTNGTSWSALGGSPPTAKYWLTFDNKVYALNNTGYTSRMRWSDDGTIETWTATNIQDIATNIGVGDEITGGTVNNNNLIVFKNYSTWLWDTYSLTTLNTTVGCRAPKSIATIDNYTFWLSHKGVYASTGGKPFRISNAIKDFIDGITDITAPVGWAEDNFYYLYIGTSNNVTNCLLIYDLDNNAWSYKQMGVAVKQATSLTTSANVRNMYFGDSAGQVYKFKTGTSDNTAAIPFKWVGVPQLSDNDYLNYIKDFKMLYVYLDRTAKTGIDVFYSVDFGEFKPLGTATKTVSMLDFPPGTRGYNVRIAYETCTTNDQQKIMGHLCTGDVLKSRLENVE